MQVFEQGSLVVREGTLFTNKPKDGEAPEYLEVTTTKTKNGDEKRYVKFSLSVAVSSTKQDDGTYKTNYEYHNYTVWDNGGASTDFINFVAKPPTDKLRFKRLSRVKLLAYVKKVEREYNGKTYYEEEIVDFLHLYKIMGNQSTKSESPENSKGITETDEKDIDDVPF